MDIFFYMYVQTLRLGVSMGEFYIFKPPNEFF